LHIDFCPLLRLLAVSSFKHVGFLCGLVVGATISVDGAELDTVLARHMEAIGGSEAVSRLNSLKASGTVLISDQRAPFELWAAFPNKLRIESLIGNRVLVQSYDGKRPPWQWFPETLYAIPEEMEPEVAREFVSDADFNGPLVNHRGKGHQLELVNRETLDGREAFRIRVVERSGLESTLAIDAESYLVVRRSGVRRGGGASIDLDTYYLDYRDVSGVLLPHRYEVYRGTTLVRTVIIQTLEGNRRIPSAVFELPDGPDPVAARVEAEG
jgi:hypothetical protein